MAIETRDTHVRSASVDTPRTLPLDRIVEEVRRDSREQAEQYLDNTTVPHGGE